MILNRYFAAERDAIEVLEAKRDAISRQIEELDEEHGGEEGLLMEAKNDKGKVTKATISNRVKQLRIENGQLIVKEEGKQRQLRIENGQLTIDDERAQEMALLKQYLDLIEQEAEANRKVKEAQKTLETKVIAQYGKLSVDEIKTLVVDDKWLTTIAAAVQSELDRVSQALTGRIKTLAERYAAPLPVLVAEVETLAAKVNEHLARMSVAF